MGRILAIDYGVKRTGLAVSDPLQIIAGALETVETKQLERYIADYCAREDVTTIVVGKPSQMNGEKSETMRYIETLVGRLRHNFPDKVYASVAQLVEQGTENPRVVGSIPTGGTIPRI